MCSETTCTKFDLALDSALQTKTEKDGTVEMITVSFHICKGNVPGHSKRARTCLACRRETDMAAASIFDEGRFKKTWWSLLLHKDQTPRQQRKQDHRLFKVQQGNDMDIELSFLIFVPFLYLWEQYLLVVSPAHLFLIQ